MNILGSVWYKYETLGGHVYSVSLSFYSSNAFFVILQTLLALVFNVYK
jgi:hypothetical protein